MQHLSHAGNFSSQGLSNCRKSVEYIIVQKKTIFVPLQLSNVYSKCMYSMYLKLKIISSQSKKHFCVYPCSQQNRPGNKMVLVQTCPRFKQVNGKKSSSEPSIYINEY